MSHSVIPAQTGNNPIISILASHLALPWVHGQSTDPVPAGAFLARLANEVEASLGVRLSPAVIGKMAATLPGVSWSKSSGNYYSGYTLETRAERAERHVRFGHSYGDDCLWRRARGDRGAFDASLRSPAAD